jgi:lactoylglutathione lyase
MKFGYTIIYVASVPKALSFYKEAFDIPTKFLHESSEYGELSTGETTLAFASHSMGDANFKGQYVRADQSATPLGIEIALVTEDIASAYAKALRAGAISISAPADKPWGQTVAYVRGTEGTLIELCSPIG